MDEDIQEVLMNGWLDLCEWACREGVYDDVTKGCDCWGDEDDSEYWYEDIDEWLSDG